MSGLFKKKPKPDETSVTSSPQVKQKIVNTGTTAATVNGNHFVTSTNGHPGNSSQDRATTDPDTCLEVFKCHWCQVCAILNKGKQESGAVVNRSPQEDLDTVIRYLDQMMLLLVEETDQNGAQGPILQYILEEDVLTKLFEWTRTQVQFAERLHFHHLKMIDMLISQSRQQLMVHKPIIRPVLQFLNSCQEHPNKNIEQHLILVLHQLCVSVTQNTHLLEVLFSASSEQGPARFLIFSLLIPYIHHEGSIGQQARDALLLIMSLSSRHQSIGQYIAENSDFCPVLATGLSGLYSSLPRKLDPPSDDWYQISQEDVNKCPDLLMFLNSLEFCNAVVQVAHPLVASQLMSFILQGFLSPVMGPALHQNDIVLPVPESVDGDYDSVFLDEDDDVSSMEEVIAATAYLDLFLRRISEPALLCIFVKFIISAKYEDVTILDSLTARIQSNSRLCMVTLTLFKTLIDLNCEDIMFQLIFKYLIPCTHVMVSQRRAVRDVDMYGKTAEKLLSLKPNCSAVQSNDGGAPRSRQSSVSSQDSLQITPTSLTSTFPSANNPNLGTPTTIKKRSWRNFGKNNSLEKTGSNSMPAMSPAQSQSSTAESYESSYIDYLTSARVKILSCAEACLGWAAPYDGENPAPDSLVKKDKIKEEDIKDVEAGANEDSSNFGVQRDLSKQMVESLEVNSHTQASDSSQSNSNTQAVELTKPDTEKSLNASSKQGLCDSTEYNKNVNTVQSNGGQTNSGYNVQNKEGESSRNNNDKNVKENSHEDSSQESATQGTNSDTKFESQNQKPGQHDSSYAESVSSETDSGLSGSSCNVEHLPSGCFHEARPRADSPLHDTFDTSEFNSFLLSLKRVQTPVEYSPSMEDCLNDIDALVTEYRRSSLKSVRTSQSSQESMAQSPLDNKMFERSFSKTLSPSSVDLSRDSCIYSMPKSGSLESMSPTTPLKPSPSLLNLSASAPFFTPTKYNVGKPDIGPFLLTILSKLECMMQNSLYVNLLLSGLVTRLACYPQPLLRSFLLNHSLVFQPTVKSLVQVLSSVKHKVDNYAMTVRDFDNLLNKARQFLQWREDQLFIGGPQGGARARSDSNLSLAPVTATSSSLKNKERKRMSIGDFFRSKSKKPTQPRVQLLQTGKGFRYLNRMDVPGSEIEENPLEALRTKNAVYCALVLEEFLKELAALSQEHAVLSPTLMPS